MADNEMKTVELAPGVSLMEVADRFYKARPGGTLMIRLQHGTRYVPKKKGPNDDPGTKRKMKQVEVWRAQFVGPTPDLSGLLPRPIDETDPVRGY